MGVERGPAWLILGAFPQNRVDVFVQAAEELEIPSELISNDDPRVNYPNSFKQAMDGEQVILVEYGDRYEEFNKRVNEISPPPPPQGPIGKNPDSEVTEEVLVNSVDQI